MRALLGLFSSGPTLAEFEKRAKEIEEDRKQIKSHIDKLEAITNTLPKFPPVVVSKDDYTEYQMDEGYCKAYNLYNGSDCSIARWFSTKGTKFPEHIHSQKEWIIICNGAMLFKLDDMEFDNKGTIINFGISSDDILLKTIKSGLPFLTSGCPGCNRPYYNERPGQELYNFPEPLSIQELNRIEKQFESIIQGLNQ